LNATEICADQRVPIVLTLAQAEMVRLPY